MVEATRENLTDALVQQAVMLQGEERAGLLRPGLDERAEQLWLLDQAPLDREEEPAVIFIP
jgi:hypothetical protein